MVVVVERLRIRNYSGGAREELRVGGFYDDSLKVVAQKMSLWRLRAWVRK